MTKLQIFTTLRGTKTPLIVLQLLSTQNNKMLHEQNQIDENYDTLPMLLEQLEGLTEEQRRKLNSDMIENGKIAIVKNIIQVIRDVKKEALKEDIDNCH